MISKNTRNIGFAALFALAQVSLVACGVEAVGPAATSNTGNSAAPSDVPAPEGNSGVINHNTSESEEMPEYEPSKQTVAVNNDPVITPEQQAEINARFERERLEVEAQLHYREFGPFADFQYTLRNAERGVVESLIEDFVCEAVGNTANINMANARFYVGAKRLITLDGKQVWHGFASVRDTNPVITENKVTWTVRKDLAAAGEKVFCGVWYGEVVDNAVVHEYKSAVGEDVLVGETLGQSE